MAVAQWSRQRRLPDACRHRPRAAVDGAGGLADGTAKVVTVLDALGYDPVLIETVGVGQSEVEVREYIPGRSTTSTS